MNFITHLNDKQNEFLAYVATVILYIVATIRLPSENIRAMFILIFTSAIIFLIGILIIKFINIWVGLFLLLSYWSTIYPTYAWETNYTAKLLIEYLRLSSFLNIFLAVLWFVFIVIFIKKTQFEKIFNAFCIISLMTVVLLILQKLNFDPIYYIKGMEARNSDTIGFLSCRNEVAAFLTICFPAFLRKKWIWTIPLIFIGIILSKSFLSIFTIAISVSFYFICLNPYLGIEIIFIGITCILIYYFKIDKPSVFERWKLWKVILDIFSQHKIFGCGIGIYQLIMQRIENINKELYKLVIKADGRVWWRWACNEFLQGYVEIGIGFIICVGGYLINSIFKFKKENILYYTALLAIIISSCCTYVFHNPINALFAVTWLGLLEIKSKENYNV